MIVVVFHLFYGLAGAANLDVTVANSAVNAYNMVGTSNKVTMGNSLPPCTMIAGRMKNNLGQNTVNMNGRSGIYYLSMQDSEAIAEEVCIGFNPNYKIYKTTVDGIGVSFNDADSASASLGQPIGKWPQLTTKFTRSGSAIAIGAWVDIRLWKYSSAADHLPYGIVEITTPKILQMVGAVAGDTLNSCSSILATAGATRVCLTEQRTPKYTTSIYASTCEMIGGSKTVQMGEHPFPSASPAGYSSAWVDASFQLRCPKAWGYNQDPTNLATLSLNNTVKITINALNGVENGSQGIIKLDGTGALGVGIQLAWGDYSSQAATPANPVKLSVPTDATTLSSSFIAGPYAQGSNVITGNGMATIKMAARYIRTTGNLQAGLAKSRVEVLANYQ